MGNGGLGIPEAVQQGGLFSFGGQWCQPSVEAPIDLPKKKETGRPRWPVPLKAV
jgi:hypothetical protein